MNLASFNRLVAFAVLTSALACNRQTSSLPESGAERLAIYPIENLSGRSDLAGVARVLPILIEYQLTGLADVIPVAVSSPNGAAGKRAFRELRGYLEAHGGGITVKLQDRSPSGKIERLIEAEGTELGQIANTISHRLNANARALPAGTNAAEALNAFAVGLTTLGTPESIQQLTRAAQLAPAFGPAWLQLGAAVWAQGNAAQATQVWQNALASTLDPVSQARIRTELATKAHIGDLASAYLELARALPHDIETQGLAGDALFNAGRYAETAGLLKAAVELAPGTGALRNTLAYSQALSGDYPSALANITAYEQLEPKNPNARDSKGEIQFLTRHFAEAARTFESVATLDPNFQQGFARRKAAEAYLQAGDPASANRVMSTWGATLPDGSPARERFLAVWEHRTGKRKEAIERLVRVAPQDPLAATEAIVWLIQEGDRPRAAALAAGIQGPSNILLRFLAQPSAPAATWTQRAATTFPAPQARTALMYGLAFDNHWTELATLLASDAPKLNPTQTSQMLALYRRALMEAKRPEDLKTLPDFPMLPTQGPDSLFDSLIYVQ